MWMGQKLVLRPDACVCPEIYKDVPGMLILILMMMMMMDDLIPHDDMKISYMLDPISI